MTPARSAAKASLQEAFDAWVVKHGYVWFEDDLALAAALAKYLGVNVKIDGVAVADEIPGVKQA